MTTNHVKFEAMPTKIIISILFVVAFLLYIQTLSFKRLEWDDLLYVGYPSNGVDVSWSNIKEAFDLKNPKNEFGYKPVQILSYSFDNIIYNGNTYGYRLTNILLHALCTVLAYLIIKELSSNKLAAFLSALLFATFPYHTEAVCWISERKGLLACFFIFTAYLCDLKFWKSNKKSYAALAAVALILSLLSKGMWVTYPAISLLTGFFISQQNKQLKPNFKRWLKFILPIYIIISAGVIYIQLKLGNANSTQPLGENIFERLMFVNLTYWHYLAAFFNPENINPVNLWAWDGLPCPAITYGALAASMVIFIVAIRYYQKRPEFLFLSLLFIVTLLPVSNIIPMLYPHGDRFLYGPSLIILTVMGIWFSKILKANILKFIPALVIILYAGYTLIVSQYWVDGMTLFSYVSVKDPLNQTANYNIAVMLERYEGKENESIDFYKKALFIHHKKYYHKTLADNAVKRLIYLYESKDMNSEIIKTLKRIENFDKISVETKQFCKNYRLTKLNFSPEDTEQ